MSLAGLKKQFNKANQYVSEKIGGAKGTELDDEFQEMERRIDVMGKLVEDLITKTQEYLQPNPASRAKLSTMNTISKFRGQGKVAPYPQPEGILGEHMIKHGKDLGEESIFGGCLQEAGETYKHLAEIKYNLEDNVKQNFLEPLALLQTKDLKEVNHHRKKLSGRRLDFDCKRRKKEKGSEGKGARDHGSHITDDELRNAEEKFEESKQIAETAMYNVLENEVEQIAQLESFVESQMDYHKQAMESLASLLEIVQDKRSDAASKPRVEHIPKRVASFRRSESPSSMFDAPKSDDYDGHSGSYNFSSNFNQTQTGYEGFNAFDEFEGGSSQQPCVKALYDFVPENEGELGFQEGDIINLLTQIDENWYEGSIHGNMGFFPVNYVEVVVPLP